MESFKRFLLVLSVLCLLSAWTHAEEPAVYELDEVDLTVEVSPRLIVFTTDIDKNDPNLAAYGLTKKEQQKKMSDGDILLDIWDKEVTYEIFVSSDPAVGSMKDFNDCTPELLTQYCEAFSNASDDGSVWSVYDTGYMAFLKQEFTDAGNRDCAAQYMTVHNGACIDFTLYTLSGEYIKVMDRALTNIIDSIRPLPSEKNITTYVLDEIGMLVDVPADLIAFTREIYDPALDVRGIGREAQMAYMEDLNCYLNIFHPDHDYDITISTSDTDQPGFDHFTEEALQELADYYMENNDLDVYDTYYCEPYYNPQIGYLKGIYRSSSADGFNGAQVQTVYNGKMLYVLLSSRTGEYTEAMDSVLNGIIDSIRFKEPSVLSELPNKIINDPPASEMKEPAQTDVDSVSAPILLICAVVLLGFVALVFCIILIKQRRRK